MRKISTFLFAISCATAVILSTSCNKEDDAIPVPSTTFDKTQIESKTYNLGDSVKADIEIVPNRALKKITTTYEQTSQVYKLNEQSLNGINQKFTYPMKFKLDDKFKGDKNALIIISAEFSVPDEGGRTGVRVSEFRVNINQ